MWMMKILKKKSLDVFPIPPTTIQAIGVLRGIHQRQNEQGCLHAARYEFVHNRVNHITPEEQTQVNENNTLCIDSTTSPSEEYC